MCPVNALETLECYCNLILNFLTILRLCEQAPRIYVRVRLTKLTHNELLNCGLDDNFFKENCLTVALTIHRPYFYLIFGQILMNKY